MKYRVKDPVGGEIRDMAITAQGKLLGNNVADVCQGAEITTTGKPFRCFSDASYSQEIEVIEVSNVENGRGYIRTDILEAID